MLPVRPFGPGRQAVREALIILRTEPDRRAKLAALVAHANALVEVRCGLPPSGSQILPVIIGENARVMAVAEALQAQRFDVRGVRPPTVPEGTARLRISITLNADQNSVSEMVDALAEELAAAV